MTVDDRIRGRRWRRHRRPARALTIALVAVSLLLGVVSAPAAEADDHFRRLSVSVDRASVAPDGDLAGAPTDVVVTFRPIDPSVDGVGLEAGGTIRVTMPKAFRNTGSLPVLATGAEPGCAPPLVTTCSTAVITQGWPQSPVLPFPDVTWEAETNSIVLTATAPWKPAGVAAPGPKQVHLMLFGFVNPDRPGRYRFQVEIRPDPASDQVLRGSGRLEVTRRITPSINPNSQANGAPPPPFANTLFQEVAAGDPSLTMRFFLWDRDGSAHVGVDFPAGADRVRSILDGEGRRIGSVKVFAPPGATGWSLASGGPAVEGPAFITGIPTGILTAVLQTDPDHPGEYRLRFKLRNGNTLEHVIVAS